MGLMCKQVGKMRSMERKLENRLVKEKQLQMQKRKEKNNKKYVVADAET